MTWQPLMGQTRSYGLSPVREGGTRCKRGCCWSPYGHSAAAVNCQCHPEEEA